MRLSYNNLNLPDSAYFMLRGNTLKMEYMADGRRVRTTAKTYGTPLLIPVGGTPMPQEPASVTEEVRDGELVFRDGRLVEVRTDGGWFSMWNDTLSTTQVRPYFYVTDYLGSVRMVCDGITGEVQQSIEYLPSGHIFRSENYGTQPYMFCGKELITMHGLNLYDSNARFQHSTQPRFSSMDPQAEKYYSLSPYNYAGNDPVNAADPSGMTLFILGEDGRLLDSNNGFLFSDYDQIAIVHNGRLVYSEKYDAGSIQYGGKKLFEHIPGVLFQSFCFKLTGDEIGSSLFEFVSKKSEVEWSLIRTGKDSSGLNYLTTSQLYNKEYGGGMLLMDFLQDDVAVRGHIHNHPSPYSAYPSFYDDEPSQGDMGFATWIHKSFPYQIKLSVYAYWNGSYHYVTYNHNSKPTDFLGWVIRL